MPILVYGAGVSGTVYAALLKLSGNEVHLTGARAAARRNTAVRAGN